VDFERAQELMVEWEASDPDISAALVRCPQCGSSNIEYPQMTRKFLTPALVGVLCAMKIIPKEFYCQDCNFTWTNQEEPTIGRLWHRFCPCGETSECSGKNPRAAAAKQTRMKNTPNAQRLSLNAQTVNSELRVGRWALAVQRFCSQP